ncbi:TetR/AcrR family transcriptional regulator [Mycolicibacterium frederiksbergense]|nr:TetR family transcriptional regulator [Mycolicibacterium frederiksbergense]
MKRSADRTREAILAAAREQFAAAGYQGTTIRAVAAAAGIDPALVIRYFGTKDKLFATASEFDLRFPDFSAMDRSRMGWLLVEHFLNRWEGDEALTVLLRSATTNAEAAQRMRDIFGAQLVPVVATVAPAAEAERRAGLIGSQMMGLALCRFVLAVPPVAAMTREEIVSSIGPTIQRYLSGELA